MDASQERQQRKLGYSKPSTQVRAGPAPLASFEDLPTDDQFSEASLIEDLPCMSECLDDRMYHDTLGDKRKVFQRSDTSFSADMDGSLITLTPTCSITPTELGSPTKTLTPVTPVNPIVNHFTSHNQFMNQQSQPQANQFTNQQILNHQLINRQQHISQHHIDPTSIHHLNNLRGRDVTPSNKRQSSIEAFKVPLSPSITLNDIDEQINVEQLTCKPVRKGSWTNFFRNRSKSTGGGTTASSSVIAKSPTPSFTSFFSSKQSNSQLNNSQQTGKSKKRRMSSIFSFFSVFKRSTRSSLQDLSKQENDLNKSNLLSTNLDKITSASSPKVLNDYNYAVAGSNYGDVVLQDNDYYDDSKEEEQHHPQQQQRIIDSFDDENGYIEAGAQILIHGNGESSVISLTKSQFGSQHSAKEFASQIEIVVKEKDEEFEKKIKDDIYLEDKILDADIPIELLEKKMNLATSPTNITTNEAHELDKKEVLFKRTLKNRSDTVDEIRSLPGRLPSFRRKNHPNATNDSVANDSSIVLDSESDDQATTITDQLSSNKTNYSKKNVNNAEVTNLLEDEDTYNELLYKMELNNSPSRLKLKDRNERLNIKLIPTERPRSATPVNFATFETFINSAANKTIDQQEKIRLQLPEDVFSEMVSANGRKYSPRKSSPQIWLEISRLQTPKYNTRRNSNTDEPQVEKISEEEAFTPLLTNSSTNETMSEYLNNSQQDQGFEDDFVNACLADLAHVIHSHQKNHTKESVKSDHQPNSISSSSLLSNEPAESTRETANCFEANFALLDDSEIKQTFDQNNNLIVDNLACENCSPNCQHRDERDKNYSDFSPKRNCSTSNMLKNGNHQRRHSISSDISSASSRLIGSSSTSSSSNSSSRRISLRDHISNERLEA